MDDEEEDSQRALNFPARTPVTTTISSQLWNLAKQYHINWVDALNIGVITLLAERDVMEYPKSKQTTKIEKLALKLDEAMRKIEELENKEPIGLQEEFDDVLSAKPEGDGD